MPISNMLPWIILLSVVAFTAWWIFRPSTRTRKTDSRVITASALLVLMSGGFVLWQSGFRPSEAEPIDGGFEQEWDNESFLSCGFCPESCIDDMSSENCSRSSLLINCIYCTRQACDFFCSGGWFPSEACKICRSEARDLCNQIRCTSPDSPGFNDSEPEPIGP